MRKSKLPFTTKIGCVYPFFLDNGELGSNYYQYQIISPGIVPGTYTPTTSFRKVSEKITKKNLPMIQEKDFNGNMRDADILSLIARRGTNIIDNYKAVVQKAFDSEEPIELYLDDKFPAYKYNAGATRNVIVSMRDSIRWNLYRFTPGYQIDIITDAGEFTVFNICGDRDTIWLEPDKTYHILDVNLKRPRTPKPQLFEIREHFSGDQKASNLNRLIRQIEWKSFM